MDFTNYKVSQKEIKKIVSKKDIILPALYEWAYTFASEVDENGKSSSIAYDCVYGLAERLENDNCDEEDYRNILFHIWQINYDEKIIDYRLI